MLKLLWGRLITQEFVLGWKFPMVFRLKEKWYFRSVLILSR